MGFLIGKFVCNLISKVSLFRTQGQIEQERLNGDLLVAWMR